MTQTTCLFPCLPTFKFRISPVMLRVSVKSLRAPLGAILVTPSLDKGLFLSIVEVVPTLEAVHTMGAHLVQLLLILETIPATVHTPYSCFLPKMLELGVAMVNKPARMPMGLEMAFAILHFECDG